MICPTCGAEYPEDVTHCPEDGALLLAPGVKNNPRLPGVRGVDTAAHTAMFTVEDMQKEMERISAAADNPELDVEPEPEPDVPVDPNATRSISLEDIDRMREEHEATHGDGRSDTATSAAPDGSGTDLDTGSTSVDATALRTRKAAAPATPQDRERRRKIAIYLLAGLGVMLLVGGGALVWAIFLRRMPVEIVTSPPGAAVLVDNVERGIAPLTVYMPRGAHAVKARADGYLEATEIVQVTQGRSLVISLKRDEGQQEPDADDPVKIKADALWEEAAALLKAGKLDEAEVKCQALSALVPDDTRAVECLREIAQRRNAGGSGKGGKATRGGKGGKRGKAGRAGKGGDGKGGEDGEDGAGEADDLGAQIRRMKPAERKKAALRALEQGRTAYDLGDMKLSGEWLNKCLRYNPNQTQCHRVMARVYTKEDNTPKVKYHLKRYLELGGADEDFKVRDWLRTH